MFFPFLLDRSAVIRRSCQSLIDARLHGSAVGFYRNVIGTAPAAKTEICVLGLSETGDQRDASAITRFLSGHSSGTRCAAIRALRTLEADGDLDLLTFVALDTPSVAREAGISLLVGRRTTAYVIWQKCLENPDQRVWLARLKLLRRPGKWTQIRVYLEAVSLSDNLISTYAVRQLQHWMGRYNRSFAQPTTDERPILRESFERIRSGLPTELSHQLNFACCKTPSGNRRGVSPFCFFQLGRLALLPRYPRNPPRCAHPFAASH